MSEENTKWYIKPLRSALYWFVDRDRAKIKIDLKCADRITFICSGEAKINQKNPWNAI